MENFKQPSQKLNGSSTSDLLLNDDPSRNTKQVLVAKRSHRRNKRSEECDTIDDSSSPKVKGMKLVDFIQSQERLFPWSFDIQGNCEPGVTPLDDEDGAGGELEARLDEGVVPCVDKRSRHLEECESSNRPSGTKTKRKAVKLIDFINQQKKLYPWIDETENGCDENTNDVYETENKAPSRLDTLLALDEEVAEQLEWLQQISSNSSRDAESSASAPKRKKRLTPKKLVAELTQDLNLSKISEECEGECLLTINQAHFLTH